MQWTRQGTLEDASFRFEERGAFWRAHTAWLREERERDATALAGHTPIHPRVLHPGSVATAAELLNRAAPAPPH